MEIKEVEITKLTPYSDNARVHNEEQINQLIASIKEFGFTNPVLIDENKTVIAGHGRLTAAQQMGLEKIPTIVLSGLTEKQKRAYVIADNKLALNAEWNDDILLKEIAVLSDMDFDLALMGWSENEINSFIAPLEAVYNKKDYLGSQEINLEDIDNFQNICPRCGFEFS